METEFTADDVVALYKQCKTMGIKLWIDGGWGVDALLEKQTRPHSDIDIVIQEKDKQKLRDYLESQGYVDVPRDDTRPINFVLGDAEGRLVDFHVIVLDDEGKGIYGSEEFFYPAASLKGIGKIKDLQVHCISPEWLVKFHMGYEKRDSDYHDVTRLCEKFDIPLPEEYQTKSD